MANDVILYRTDDGESAIELHLDNGTVWLTQQELAELFQTSKQNISKHIKANSGCQLSVDNHSSRCNGW